jgi:hypothetical protein
MNYEDELRAKLDAVRPVVEERSNVVDVTARETQVLETLQEAFVFSRYDLEEGDLLRTMKILQYLEAYPGCFDESESLRLFYTLARLEIVTPARLHRFMELPAEELKRMLKRMAAAGLLHLNGDGELELTPEGQSLAERIGVDSFF